MSQDFSLKKPKMCFLKTKLGGRILEIKMGLCERVQGRILGVCNRRTREAIAVFSPKANAKTKKKPTLKQRR